MDGDGVAFDGASEIATMARVAPDQATKEKVVLCGDNVAQVTAVNDKMTAASAEPESESHNVVHGDNLSNANNAFHCSPIQYPLIYEADKPMLTHPDKIYPGLVLRIPAT